MTRQSLKSKETLEGFLYEKVIEGTIKCTDVSVYDIDHWRKEIYEDETKKVITAEYLNWFDYYIVARIESRISDSRLKKKIGLPSPKRTNKACTGQSGSSAFLTIFSALSFSDPDRCPRPPTEGHVHCKARFLFKHL